MWIRILLLTFFMSLFASAKLHCVVSIPPLKGFIETIGDGRVDVDVMVQPGNSPHTYEPKPSQMKAIEQADCYFAIGVEFEKAWLPRFLAQNPRMLVVDLSEGIEKIPMASHQEHEESGHHHEAELDPHIWTSPTNVLKIGKKIEETLVRLDPKDRELFEKNYRQFQKMVHSTDRAIRKTLSGIPSNSAFMVLHPSWGYFAREYGLRQLPVEVEGKAPKPRQLMLLLKKANEEKVRAIFVQPEFSEKSAKLLGQELKIPVIKISPLAADWSRNLLRLARAIAQEEPKR